MTKTQRYLLVGLGVYVAIGLYFKMRPQSAELVTAPLGLDWPRALYGLAAWGG